MVPAANATHTQDTIFIIPKVHDPVGAKHVSAAEAALDGLGEAISVLR
jgi:hypothetical protein